MHFGNGDKPNRPTPFPGPGWRYCNKDHCNTKVKIAYPKMIVLSEFTELVLNDRKICHS